MKRPRINTIFWKRGDAEFYKEYTIKIIWTWTIPIIVSFTLSLALRSYIMASFFGFFIILMLMMNQSFKKYKKEMREEIKNG